MARKLPDKNQIAAASTLIVVGAEAAHKAWEALNKDDRVSDALRGLGAKLKASASVRSPEARLLKQLDLIDEYALKLGAHPAGADRATAWLQESSSIRAKLPLVQAQPGRQGKVNLKQLRARASGLLTEIITSDLAPDDPLG
ncbi:hypothetical protein ACQB6R_09900 [Propionibacteriaceae bacterium G1746]|uniref:hypothetical protein n=1 Tax=Aestuariimicrobium sp. G57 TaxID=3418485 RepID=UPI003C13C51D